MTTEFKGRKRSSAVSGDQLVALVSRAKAGDVSAFEQLYGIFSRRIVNYIFRMTGSRAQADDLTQETFIQAFKKLNTLKEDGKFQSWLFRIAQNQVYQEYRGKKPQVDSIDDEDGPELMDSQKMATSSGSPESQILASELRELVNQVINELPDKYREVFVLSALQRLSYQEICEIVGRSLASVKSDIHRARVQVRDKIKDYLGENYGMSNLL